MNNITLQIPDTYVDTMMEMGCFRGGCIFTPITTKRSGVVVGMGCDCIQVDRGQGGASHHERAVRGIMKQVVQAIADQLNAPSTTPRGDTYD